MWSGPARVDSVHRACIARPVQRGSCLGQLDITKLAVKEHSPSVSVAKVFDPWLSCVRLAPASSRGTTR